MFMVVECDSCHSRFRVKKELLDGSFAIRFRCRVCDGFIVVGNPEMHKIAAIPSPPRPISSLPPEVLAAPATVPAPEKPAIVSKPAPPESANATGIRLEDLVPFVSEGEARSDQTTISGTGAVNRAAAETRSTTFKKRAWVTIMLSCVAGLGILLLASGAYYFGALDFLGRSLGKKSPNPRSSSAAPAPAKPAYDVLNLESYIPREAMAGDLFVITGTVKNVGKGPSHGIRVRATLFGKDNQVLIHQASIAGNYIDKFTLPHMMRSAIEGHLAAARFKAGNGSQDIPPGTSLPFIVVCFDPPGRVEYFEVLATDDDL